MGVVGGGRGNTKCDTFILTGICMVVDAVGETLEYLYMHPEAVD
jgi:hypothetical protein